MTARDLPRQSARLPVLRVLSLGHGLHAWVNDEYLGEFYLQNIKKRKQYSIIEAVYSV